MNPQAKAAWVFELRSRRWKQIASGLCDEGNGRCILGCLCEAYRRAFSSGYFEKDSIPMPSGEDEPAGVMSSYKFKSIDGIPLKDWADLNDSDKRLIRYEGEMMDVSALNNIGVPFDVLADLIEAQL